MALAVTYNGEPSSSQFAPSQWKDNFTQRTCGWYDCRRRCCCERKGGRRRKREEWIMDRHTRSQRESERVRIIEGDIERKWESVCKRVREREKEVRKRKREVLEGESWMGENPPSSLPWHQQRRRNQIFRSTTTAASDVPTLFSLSLSLSLSNSDTHTRTRTHTNYLFLTLSHTHTHTLSPKQIIRLCSFVCS